MSLLCAAIVLLSTMQPPDIAIIARDSMSGVEVPRQAVVRNDQEWSALWQQHAGAKPLPKVDFSKRTVVAVFLGSRPSAGYSVEVSGTRREGETLIVEWQFMAHLKVADQDVDAAVRGFLLIDLAAHAVQEIELFIG